ncbi:MAG: YqgE/AlgH family protein [Devosia sp.]|uniref:YqgE/AlgH family protein n=1 Tax=Devosia sp. TaxID=1871048 RepID=UPI001AC560A2|nr:YqgE/AlgH family protein [Devosia sp.]MBN9308408.1 YqgE/AlgH family protein [Devosia sp.]MBN9314164.1 YqgE/AlgH family protein [Devosia sp.]
MDTLRGQFLVAMPEMGDERFRDTVIYLVGHGEEGAMGLVINQSLEDMRFADILEELKLGDKDELIQLPDKVKNRQVLRGGPVQRSRGFVLHSSDYFRAGNSYEVTDEICLTATLDILKAMAFNDEPSEALFALGYCGWSPGQLENEIQGNGWLTVPFSRELLFGLPIENRYDAALARLGITRATLSASAGHG